MHFIPTTLNGAYIIRIERLADERGFFGRVFCRREFAKMGLNPDMTQGNVSFNHKKGTVRGLHFQNPPYMEAKLVSCTRGAIFDVVVDLRTNSPTYLHWYGVTLTERNRDRLYVPEGFAHGYQTLIDNSEFFYHSTAVYQANEENGIRWNDPALDILWPVTLGIIISDKDQNWPDWTDRKPGPDAKERLSGEKDSYACNAQ